MGNFEGREKGQPIVEYRERLLSAVQNS